LTANDEVLLVVAELVTNAVVHGTPPIRLSATPHANALHIAVRDGRPDIGPAGPNSRGLQIVDAVALHCGVRCEPDGKIVWAILPV
jgi:anti-sigma regulatory factor (Ser/Thr protein kinase)